jgi:hypothetical protein
MRARRMTNGLVLGAVIALSSCRAGQRVVSCDEVLGGMRACWEWRGISADLERWHQSHCSGQWAGPCPRKTALGACTGGEQKVFIWYYPNAAAGLLTPADVEKRMCDRNGATFIAP